MECLNTELLCMYLGNEMEADLQAEVTEHLRTCQRCTDAWRTLMAQDARLRSAPPSPQRPAERRQACYSGEVFSAYVQDLLTASEESRFEQHLHTCDVCLREVTVLSNTLLLMQRQPLTAPPVSLSAAVQSNFRAAGQPSVMTQLGAVVIQIATDGLKFLEALLISEEVRLAIGGQLIPARAFRSTAGGVVAAGFLEIQESVGVLDLQLSVLQEDASTVELTVQLRKQGQPLARQRVALAVDGRLLSSGTTSTQGVVEFSRLSPGEYTIRVPQENVETRLVLRAAAGPAAVG